MNLVNLQTPERQERRLKILRYVLDHRTLTGPEMEHAIGINNSTSGAVLKLFRREEWITAKKNRKESIRFTVINVTAIKQAIADVERLQADPFAVTPARAQIGAFARSVEMFSMQELKAASTVPEATISRCLMDLVALGLLHRGKHRNSKKETIRWSIKPFAEVVETVPAPIALEDPLTVHGMLYSDYKLSLGLDVGLKVPESLNYLERNPVEDAQVKGL